MQPVQQLIQKKH